MEYPLEWKPEDIPKVVATLADEKDLEFAIDTVRSVLDVARTSGVLEMRSRVRSNEFQEIRIDFTEPPQG